jgi:hypothetical protein
MPYQSCAPDVLVRVVPRLLGDALCVVLREEGLTVAVCPDVERRAEPRPPRRFDVAVVTSALPADASCDRVIRIDEDGSVLDPADRPIGGASLEVLLATVRDALEPRKCGNAT